MNRHRTGCAAVIALAAALMTISACGTTAAGSRAGDATACPARAPALAVPTVGMRTPDLPSGAVTATICQYAPFLTGTKARMAPLRRLVLRGPAADGLRAVLNGTGPMTQQATQCDRVSSLVPFVQVIYLGYGSGRTTRAEVTFTTCQLAVVTAADRFGLLPTPIQDDLFFYTTLTAHDRGPHVPGVIGLTAARASRVAARHHFALTLDGEVVDPAVPSGTVIFQVLPPAVPDAGPSPYSLGTIVAAHIAPDCQASQLRLSYRGGGAGTGSDFGVVLVRDVAAAPCRLAGQLQLTGVAATGRPLTNAVTAAIAAPGVLTPNLQPVRDGAPVPPGVLAWLLQAPYRDDPTAPNGLCTAHYVIPARWRVRLPDGSVIVVPNADSGSLVRFTSSGGLVTCRGRILATNQAALGG